jgi:hypothetical protein
MIGMLAVKIYVYVHTSYIPSEHINIYSCAYNVTTTVSVPFSPFLILTPLVLDPITAVL